MMTAAGGEVVGGGAGFRGDDGGVIEWAAVPRAAGPVMRGEGREQVRRGRGRRGHRRRGGRRVVGEGVGSRGPVWVAGASVVAAAVSFVPGAREWVYSRLGSVGRYLTGETAVPRVVVGLLVLAAAPSLWPVFRAVWGMRRSYRREYRSGVEMGVMWRWDYSKVDGSVEGVVPHCLVDDARLEWVESEGGRVGRGGGLLLVCPVCGKAYGPVPGPPRALLDRVGRRIRYEVVTEGWRGEG